MNAAAFTALYVPVGVPTFHLESARDRFEASCRLLKKLDADVVCPEEMLLSLDSLRAFLDGKQPDLIIFQNLTFANAAYMSEVLRRFDCPMLLWTLREPVIDGGRLRLNSLTGAYSAANALRAFNDRPFAYLFGAPEEERAETELSAVLAAARVKKAMRSLKLAAVGHTPQGFGFGRALDSELMNVFGEELEAIEARELIDAAKAFSDADCAEYLEKTIRATCGFDKTPERNRLDHARLYKAYSDYVRGHGIGALASRCWPDFFTAFGTPVCTVLSLLNDDGVAAACSLARKDTGAAVGVHPNRKIGPAMDFGCEAFPAATVFRIGREPDGSFRFFLAEGEALDRPRQFTGTSVVVKTDSPCRELVEQSVLDGFEPHFVVMKGRHARALEALAVMFGFEVYRY